MKANEEYSLFFERILKFNLGADDKITQTVATPSSGIYDEVVHVNVTEWTGNELSIVVKSGDFEVYSVLYVFDKTVNIASVTDDYKTDANHRAGFSDEDSGLPLDIMQNGQYIWVTTSTGVSIFKFVLVNQKDEFTYDSYDSIYLDPTTARLCLVGRIKLDDPVYWITRSHSHAYISNKYKDFDKITKIDLSTRQVIEVIDVPKDTDGNPKLMRSNLVFESGKLWMVDKAKADQLGLDRQYLYYYDTITKVWNATDIPTRKQFVRAHLTPGNDGFVYVTNFNNVSISKFNAQTGAFDSIIRTNAFPQTMTVTSNRDILVSSFGGMVTKVQAVSGDVSNAYSSLGTAISLAPAGDDYVWFVGTKPKDPKVKDDDKKKDAFTLPSIDGAPASYHDLVDNDGWPVGTKNPKEDFFIGRLNRSTNEVFFTGETHEKISVNYWFDNKEDWNIGYVDGNKATGIYTTVPFSVKQLTSGVWNTINIGQYLIWIQNDNYLCIVKLDREFYRTANFEFTGQSMISTGSEDYMGDVGSGEADVDDTPIQ